MAVTGHPNNPMTFTENQHGTAVLEKLRNQRELVRCCDVILHVAGLQFQAHRCVLAACSPYFDSIFKASKTVKEQLTISSQDPEVFRCLLAYMYTGTVVVDKTNVAELLRLANKLLIAKLKDHCAEYLERYLDVTNCLTVRDMATKFHLESLEKTTGTYIGSHLKEVVEGEEVLDLSHSRLEDFLSSPCWQLQENQTLLLVTRWVHHCPKMRERNLRSLLTWVQWCRLDPQAAIQLMQTHPLYSSSSSSSLLSLFFLLDALNDNGLLPDDLCNAYFKLKAKYCQPTESLVDNESFLSLAISTAIDELQEDPVATNRPQEVTTNANDFCNHSSLPSHASQGFNISETDKVAANVSVAQPHQNASDFPISLRRCCEDDDGDQQVHYDLCRISHGTDDLHIPQSSLVLSHQSSLPNSAISHSQDSEDSAKDVNASDESKFPCNAQDYFSQTNMRNMTVWHQENTYGNEESLSSEPGHVYQRQSYEQQGFSLKVQCNDTYNVRANQSSSYGARENIMKNKPSFPDSSVSYYLGTYNPDEEVTVSDDQSTQSFQYDENFNSGMNFYPCRVMDMKESQHNFMEPFRGQEGYPKAFYTTESTNARDIDSVKREMDYNENSTDTQLSNCPQDMTIQRDCHGLLPNKELSGIEDANAIPGTDTNMPVSLVTEQQQQHFEHYTENTSVMEEFHREGNRLSEEGSAAIPLRDVVPEDLASENKRGMSMCELEMRNFLLLKEEVHQWKDHRKEVSLEDKFTSKKMEGLEQDGSLDGVKHISTDNMHLLTPLEANVTPRDVKFKINRSVNLAPGGISMTVSVRQRSFAELVSDDTNPDDPAEMKMEKLPPPRRDISETVVGKPAAPSEYQRTEEDKGGTKSTTDEKELVATTRRTSARSKAIEADKGSRTATSSSATSSVQRVCDVCQASFSRSKEYFIHMREHFPGPPHRCNTCDSSFKRIYHLLEHLVIHQENKSHKCPHCPFSTRKKFNLTEHMAKHSKIRKYKCKICGEQFSRIQILQIHETKHTSDRPFLCDTCGWSGKTKNALITHTKIHTGDLLRCQFPNCKYETAKTSHLKEHMQSHSKSRPFVCTVCSNAFITPSHLKRHMKLHLSEKPYKCYDCDYATMRQDYLKTHMKKHTKKKSVKTTTRKRENKKSSEVIPTTQSNMEVTNVIAAIECSQADIFSDLENTNVSLQPQLPGTPPPTTLTEYPPSPTSYTFQPHTGPEDTLMIVPDMSSVTESFAQLPHASPLHRNLGSSLNYDESYHSPQYQTSPSHFAALSPTNTTLSYSNGHQQEENPLNFAAYMKYD